MFTRTKNDCTMSVDFENGYIESIRLYGKEIINGKTPLFSVGMRDEAGDMEIFTAYDAKKCDVSICGEDVSAVYSGFDKDVKIYISVCGECLAEWYIKVENNTGKLVEWVKYPDIALKPLKKNGGDASILCTYNEGAICDDIEQRQRSWFGHREQEYPSFGLHWTFPNMISSQFQCYLAGDCGLYIGVHDAERGVKGISFFPDNGNVIMQQKIFTGIDAGEDFNCEYPIVFDTFKGTWHKGAEIYRQWFENNLPSNVKKIKDNPNIPEWYKDSPLVLTYCVRGMHDMDEMSPNALFPYENALPYIDEIAGRVDSRLLVLLMHWEGTAPWAPPYVWPPYGGEEMFNRFADKLHQKNHLLGVYCSGFSWTIKSNLVDDYDDGGRYEKENLSDAMCAAPDGSVNLSKICTGQRSGYDICVASSLGRKILDEAYQPLFESSVDYVQILDQNHGGGQYLCHSKKHGHPSAPGKWMTASMRKLLDGWNCRGMGKLFGCESAAAEPFIGNLLFSDNRYELNWHFGQPVPVYQYIYHEYLRNFQGNQCSNTLISEDTMCARVAYSFAAGDCMTLVLLADGRLMTNWSNHDFNNLPDKEKTLLLVSNLTKFYKEKAKPYLYDGRMIEPLDFKTDYMTVHLGHYNNAETTLPLIYSSAWEKDGERVQIFVNHTDSDITVELSGKSVTVKALDAQIIKL